MQRKDMTIDKNDTLYNKKKIMYLDFFLHINYRLMCQYINIFKVLINFKLDILKLKINKFSECYFGEMSHAPDIKLL